MSTADAKAPHPLRTETAQGDALNSNIDTTYQLWHTISADLQRLGPIFVNYFVLKKPSTPIEKVFKKTTNLLVENSVNLGWSIVSLSHKGVGQAWDTPGTRRDRI